MKRTIIIIAALFFGLVGLGMSLCGGGFLFAALTDAKDYMGFVIIAAPSALIGVGLTVFCFRVLVKNSDDETNRS